MALAAVVFDFDGVIIDSEPLHLRAYQLILHELGVSLSKQEYMERLLGMDDVGVFRRVAADRGIDLSDDRLATWIARKTEIIRQRLSTSPRVFEGAIECVTSLAKSVPLAIASGALRPEIEGALEALRMRSSFKAIVAAGETPHVKPHPDPYRRAVQLLGVAPSDAVAIEDSPVGIQAALGAGLSVVAVTQTYPAPRLTSADVAIDSLTAVTLDFLEDALSRGARRRAEAETGSSR